MVVGRFEAVTLRLPALRASVAGGSVIAEASCLGSVNILGRMRPLRQLGERLAQEPCSAGRAEHLTRERVCSPQKTVISAVQPISSEPHETDQSPSG
jgi:hypothetical protein